MPKTTALGAGAAGTNALDPAYQAELEEKAKRDEKNRKARERYAEKKHEEESSPGISSTKSSKSKKTSSAKPKASDPSPAPTTEPRLNPGEAVDRFSSAASADTGQEKGTAPFEDGSTEVFSKGEDELSEAQIQRVKGDESGTSNDGDFKDAREEKADEAYSTNRDLPKDRGEESGEPKERVQGV